MIWNPLLRLLLGSGRLPDSLRPALEAEGIELLTEEVPATITWENFRSPNRISMWKRQWFRSAIALTPRRIVVCRGAYKLIDVPFDDAKIRHLHIAQEEPDCLRIAYDAAALRPNESGTITLRFTTPEAGAIAKSIERRRGTPPLVGK